MHFGNSDFAKNGKVSSKNGLPRSRDNETFESDGPSSVTCSRRSSRTVEEETSDEIDDNITPMNNGHAANNNDAEHTKAPTHRPSLFGIGAVMNARNFAKKLAERHRKRHEIHIIDKISRYLFPIVFFIFNVLYFVIVLTRSNRNHD